MSTQSASWSPSTPCARKPASFGAAGDDHEIGDVGESAHIEGLDVQRLHVGQRIDDDALQRFGGLGKRRG
jgi:hypothetical protein